MCATSFCTRGALDSWSRGRSTATLGAESVRGSAETSVPDLGSNAFCRYNGRQAHFHGAGMNLSIESEQEQDGRWIAEVPQLPGVLAYGATRDEALAKAQVLALRVLADRLEHGERSAEAISISIAA